MPTNDEYRRGFIDGAVMCGATVEDARWAARNDINGARVLKEALQVSGDVSYIPQIQHFVAEARMWSRIAQAVLRHERRQKQERWWE